LSKVLFKDAKITGIRSPADGFLLLEISADSAMKFDVGPGSYYRVMIGDFESRMYTPINQNQAEGTFQFLIFDHGMSPGTTWAKSLRVGDPIRIYGPKKAHDFHKHDGASIFFGDETAIPLAIDSLRLGAEAPQNFVFEALDPSIARHLLNLFGLSEARIIEKKSDRSHLSQVATSLHTLAKELSARQIIGATESTTSKQLKALFAPSFFEHVDFHVITYWILGRAAH
jgi:NADPH-dependent ferric siderophore reductase